MVRLREATSSASRSFSLRGMLELGKKKNASANKEWESGVRKDRPAAPREPCSGQSAALFEDFDRPEKKAARFVRGCLAREKKRGKGKPERKTPGHRMSRRQKKRIVLDRRKLLCRETPLKERGPRGERIVGNPIPRHRNRTNGLTSVSRLKKTRNPPAKGDKVRGKHEERTFVEGLPSPSKAKELGGKGWAEDDPNASRSDGISPLSQEGRRRKRTHEGTGLGAGDRRRGSSPLRR